MQFLRIVICKMFLCYLYYFVQCVSHCLRKSNTSVVHCWLHGKGVRNYDGAEVYDLIRSRGGAQMGKIILL